MTQETSPKGRKTFYSLATEKEALLFRKHGSKFAIHLAMPGVYTCDKDCKNIAVEIATVVSVVEV